MTERLGILISGRGSNMAAILDAIADGELRAEARLVLSNKAAAPGLERARAAGVRTAVVRHRDYPSREAFDEAMVAELKAVEVDWVVLAGFMRIVTPVFLRAFPWRVVNIHPSLLPAFVGVDAQAQALAYGVKVSGCTVHLVDEGVDAGPILAQAAVPVRPDDDRDRLAARILEQEHRLLVDTLRRLTAGGLTIDATPEGRPRVSLKD